MKKDTLYSYCKERRISTKGTKPTEPTEPKPTTPYDEPKPSTEPTASKEQKEAVKSAPVSHNRAKILEYIDFSEYRKKCKLYQAVFGKETTNKNHVFYNYEHNRKQEAAAI